MNWRRLVPWAVLLAAGVVLGRLAAIAQEPGEYQVKAAFIYNIAKFVDWPDGGAGRTMRLCIIGSDPFGADMSALSGKTVGSRTISISALQNPADVRSCQILFVSSSESNNLDRILGAASGGTVLTIGDTDGYAQRGIVVNFFLESQKVRFEINVDAAKRARLTVSSQLLKLARIVHD